MPLDPQAEALLKQIEAFLPKNLTELEPAAVREIFRALSAPQAAPVQVARVENRTLPGPAGEIPIRIYAPDARSPLPLLVYFHGGGFVVCDLDSHDGVCRSLAAGAGCLVASVDYRLAPEAPFPAAPEDCYAALRHLAEHARELGADPARVAVAGDSAGGNLAAVVAQQARARGGPRLVHQLLVYPVTDHSFDTVSYRENAEGYLLSRDMMKWFWRHYLARPEDGASPLASPLRAPDLGGLPPATVITAGFDPLRDEGEAYAERLRRAGVPTELYRYDGLFHGFFGMGEAIERARDAMQRACSALRGAFAS